MPFRLEGEYKVFGKPAFFKTEEELRAAGPYMPLMMGDRKIIEYHGEKGVEVIDAIYMANGMSWWNVKWRKVHPAEEQSK